MPVLASERQQTAPNELKRFSFDSAAEAANLRNSSAQEIARQLTLSKEAYLAEVVADKPCSPVYPIYFDRQFAFTTPEKKPKDRMDLQFDVNEREGVPLYGFNKFTHEMRAHPGEVVLWYSRRGPAAFREDAGIFSEIKFDYDQCYVGVFDQEKNTSLVTAVKANRDKGTSQLFLEQFAVAKEHNFTEEETIKYSLSTPHTTGQTLDEFTWNEESNDLTMYVDKEGKAYTLGMIKNEIASVFFEYQSNDFAESDVYKKILADAQKGLVDQRYIQDLYKGTVRTYMQQTGKAAISLGGSCGGSTVTASDLDTLNDPFAAVKSILSSQFRIGTQGNQLALKDGKLTAEQAKTAEGVCSCGKPHEPHFHCPDKECNYPIVIGKGIENCPGCGRGKTC